MSDAIEICPVITLTAKHLKLWNKYYAEDELQKWLTSLPETCDDIADRWQCELIELIHAGAEGLTIMGKIAGRDVVVKILVRNDACRRQIRIMELLTAAQIESSVSLLGHHGAYRTLLMPYIKGIHPDISPEIDTQVQIALEELHASTLKGVRSIKPYWKTRHERTERRIQEHEISPAKIDFLRKANQLGNQLIRTTESPTMLHGDLHCDNILLDTKGHIMMFDFRGLHGDRAFDYASWVAKSTLRDDFIDPLSRLQLNSREHAWVQAILPAEAHLYDLLDSPSSAITWQWLEENWIDFKF